MKITYRPYAAKDYQQVIDCLVDLAKALAKINPMRLSDPKPTYSTHYLQAMLTYMNDNKGMILVAEDNNEIIGFVIGYIKTLSLEDALGFKPFKIGSVPDLYVKDIYRKMGIGKALMGKIQSYFEMLECDSIELSVLMTNIPAHKLYVDLGYKDTLVEMTKDLKK